LVKRWPTAALIAAGLVAAGVSVTALPPRHAKLAYESAGGAVSSPALPVAAEQVAPTDAAQQLIRAADAQIGVTTRYDPAYVTLDFPGGDVPEARGVCTDVLIRAMRSGWGIDLQLAVNRDMKAAFAAYPKIWGLARTDRNIDHRRVPNLETLLMRIGAAAPLSAGDATAFLPGDIVTSRLPGNLPHVMIVSDRTGDGGVPLVIHNIGAGTREEDALFDYPLTAHFRVGPEVMARLIALGR
jgi:uncharacterized protein